MSYRVHEKPHRPLARRTAEATTTPMRVYMTADSRMEVAFPCFYQEVKRPEPAVHHDIHYHHHVGWPVYNHPDHICQMAYKPGTCGHEGGCKTCRHYLDANTIFPIKLRDEGYNDDLDVAFDFTDARKKLAWCLPPDPDRPGLGTFPYEDMWISGHAYIDDEEQWIIRVEFWVHFGQDDMIKDVLHIPFAIKGMAPVRAGERERYDTIVIGELVILPSPLEEYSHVVH